MARAANRGASAPPFFEHKKNNRSPKPVYILLRLSAETIAPLFYSPAAFDHLINFSLQDGFEGFKVQVIRLSVFFGGHCRVKHGRANQPFDDFLQHTPGNQLSKAGFVFYEMCFFFTGLVDGRVASRTGAGSRVNSIPASRIFSIDSVRTRFIS